MSMGNSLDVLNLELLADSGLIDYFIDSNMAGKGVIFVLGIMNCYALSLMWSKYQELKRLRSTMLGMKRESMIFPQSMIMTMLFSQEKEALTSFSVPEPWKRQEEQNQPVRFE